jgi:fructose-1,6-bisphosphatase II
MEKIIVDSDVADALVPECLDAPAAWTLALIARVKKKSVRDLTVIVLDRPRHHDLMEEIRSSGARILLRAEGDVVGALEAAVRGRGADVLMGIGGVPEGLIAACAVKALGGAMLARLSPQTENERLAVEKSGLDTKRILNCDELVTSNQVYFAATGITDSVLLPSIEYRGNRVATHSMLLRAETETRRFIQAEHLLTGDL